MNSVSDLILKKGPLSPVWIAGTSHEKLGKKMVLSTDISTVAKRIMEEERVSLVLRLSGMLLKGLVVVFSKKTQYMLSDCEEIINKIKLSFKPAMIDMPDGTRRPRDDSITISGLPDGVRVEPIWDLENWANAKPNEEYFTVKPIQLNIVQSESSTAEPEVYTDSEFSSASTSQVPISFDDFGGKFTGNLPSIPRPDQTELHPEWEAIPINDDSDDLPNLPEVEDIPTELGQESEEEPQQASKPALIIDNKTTLTSKPRSTPRYRRTAVPKRKAQSKIGTNADLDSLFEVGRQIALEKAKNEEIETEPEHSDGGFGGFDIDDVEINRNETMLNPVSTSDDGGITSRRESLSASDVPLDVLRRPSFGSDATPTLFSEKRPLSLTSPFPSLRFQIEQTPARDVQESVTKDTYSVLNKIKDALGDKESITFKGAFPGAPKHRTALNFYQVLVLKSTNYINVEQEKPYGDILLSPGPQYHTN